jgi:tRNA(fMet)-specific endonuclease VapC
MTAYLLDTDHFTLIERGDALVVSNLKKHRSEEIATSVVTVEESLRGRLAVLARAANGVDRVRSYREFQESMELIGRLQVLGYDESAERIYQSFRTLKPRIGSQDLKIASVALANSCVVITRNRRDFGRVPGLAVQDWSSG